MTWYSPLQEKGQKDSFAHWFSQLADLLLINSHLVVAGVPHRLLEIEFYLYHPDHPDIFTHRSSYQETNGRWYFHRSGGSYRGGSFKGLDLTFGPEGIPGGILFRSLETSTGEVVEGPSLLVDHLLAQTGFPKVADLDQQLGESKAWQDGLPLQIVPASPPEDPRVFTSPRVGLTLKREELAPQMIPYIMKSYRFMRRAKEISKGRVYLVLSLLDQGKSPEEVHQITNCPLHYIQKYSEALAQGKNEKDFSTYLGADLKSATIARLFGTWCEHQDS